MQDATENISGEEEQEQSSPPPEINVTIAQQEDQRELPPGTVETANTSTGLETSREPIAASAPAILHDTSEEPIAVLEEPIAEPTPAPSHDILEEVIGGSAPASSLDKVHLFHPSRLYLLVLVAS